MTLRIKSLVFYPITSSAIYGYSVSTAIGSFNLLKDPHNPELFQIVNVHSDETHSPAFGYEYKTMDEIVTFLTEVHTISLKRTYEQQVVTWFEIPEPKLQDYRVLWDGDGGEWYSCQAHSVEEAKELCRNNCTKGTEYEGTRYDDPNEVVIFDVFLKVG